MSNKRLTVIHFLSYTGSARDVSRTEAYSKMFTNSVMKFGRRAPALDEIPHGCHAVRERAGDWWYLVGHRDVLADSGQLYMKGGL